MCEMHLLGFSKEQRDHIRDMLWIQIPSAPSEPGAPNPCTKTDQFI